MSRRASLDAGPDADDGPAPLPFSNLDDVLAPLLVGTGHVGRRAIARLMDMPTRPGSFQGFVRLTTPAGLLLVRLFMTGHGGATRSLSASLQVGDTRGYVSGEWFAHGATIPETMRLAATGHPLSALCETPAGFPGRDRPVERVRCLTGSTRVRIASTPATLTLDDIAPPPRRRKAGRST